MLTVHRMLQPVGDVRRTDWEVEYSGQTVREIVDAHRFPSWDIDDLVVLVDGRESDRLDEVLVDGSDVAFVPRLAYPAAIAIAQWGGTIYSINYVNTKIDLWLAKLQATLEKERQTERGDETSPTFSWRGISTNFGPGAPVPVIVGRIRAGGQVIASSVVEDSTVFQNIGRPNFGEIMRVLLCYGEGPIHTIGGLALGACGELSNLGGRYADAFRKLPAGLKINGNAIAETDPDVVAHVRTGRRGQTPVQNGLEDQSTLYLVDDELVSQVPHDYTTGDNIDTVWLLLRLPGGLYRIDEDKFVPFEVEVSVQHRPFGSTAWSAPQTWKILRPRAERTGLSYSHRIWLPSVGKWEVRITRITPDDSETTVSRSELASVTEVRQAWLAYPNRALLGLEIRGTERFSGSLSNITVPVEGILVTTYSDIGGFQNEQWEASNGEIVGRNPAWQIGTILSNTRYGFTKLDVQSDDIDWSSLADVAAHNAEWVTGPDGPERRFLFDYAFDRRSSAWEQILKICRTCRTVPLRYGSRITFRQDKAKSVAMVFPESLIEDIEVTYLNTRRAPSVINLEILNEARDYERDLIPVERTEAGLEGMPDIDAVGERPISLQLFGCMRESQARREAIFMHRSLAMRKMRITMTVPLQHLGIEVLDRIRVQSTMPRWFASMNPASGAIADGVSLGLRTAAASPNASVIVLDQDVTLVGGFTYAVSLQDSSDDYAIRTIVMAPGYYKAGTILTINEPLTCGADVAVAWGILETGWKDFTVQEIALDPSTLKATITALLYDERVYDIPDTVGPESSISSTGPSSGLVETTLPKVTDLAVDALPGGRAMRISWDRPVGYRRGRFRVWARRLVGVEAAQWEMLGDTEGTEFVFDGVEVGRSYDIAVSIEDRVAGQWQMPDDAGVLRVAAPEWPAIAPASVPAIEVVPLFEGVELRCAELHWEDLDCYEWRRGYDWLSGELVARTAVPWCLVSDAAVGAQTYRVRARGRTGLYGAETTVVVTGVYPNGVTEAATQTDLVGSDDGTHLRTQFLEAGYLELVSGATSGVYTFAELDASTLGKRWWSVLADVRVTDGRTLVAAPAGSSEALWRATGGREPSRTHPGVEFGRVIDDYTGLVVNDVAESPFGRHGLRGELWRARLEARFHDGSSWGSWSRFRNGWRRAAKMQARIDLRRASTKIAVRVHGVTSDVSTVET